jgi:integrase
MGGGQIKSAWATTCKKAGITGLTPHCLRHTFATWLKAVGVDEHDKDLLMGHASNEMSRLYAHVPQLTLIETVQRLPNGAADMQSLSEGWRKSLRNYG